MNPSHTSLYFVMVGGVRSLCLPSRLMATSVHSLLWHAEAFFFRRGMEAMPWLVHTRKIRALYSLSASKGGSPKSRQLIWKSPGNQDHSHISSACTHAFTCWQALATSSQGWLFWIDCKAILQLKNTMCQDRLQKHRRAALNIFQSWQYNGLVKTLPPVLPRHNHASFALHSSLEGANDCLL